ncbi:hypothetical protein [Phytopseudomonas dryadis]|nr:MULTISPECIES: hypothetical protein [Pseudomonas]
MSGRIGLREDARVGQLLARRIALLFMTAPRAPLPAAASCPSRHGGDAPA